MFWVEETDEWRYTDTRECVSGNDRACGHCGRPDTAEGHDGCLGTLPGVMNACCGHGEDAAAYVRLSGGKRLSGVAAKKWIMDAHAKATKDWAKICEEHPEMEKEYGPSLVPPCSTHFSSSSRRRTTDNHKGA